MTRYSLVLAIGLACVSMARADLAVWPVAAGPPAVPATERLAPCDPVSEHPNVRSNSAAGALSPGGLLGAEAWATLPVAPAAASGERVVRELPGLPGSASLFLSAMLSMGAWHVARRAGHLHLAHLPAWYHPDAPHQIGHSVAFDPLAGFEFLPVCVFETPLVAEPTPFPDTPRELPSRHESQHFLSIESPRGPPSL